MSSSKERRFEVSGTDDLGDVHSFHTDDRERAEEMQRLMSEDLEEVQLQESKKDATGA
jgi:hypothetical protein